LGEEVEGFILVSEEGIHRFLLLACNL